MEFWENFSKSISQAADQTVKSTEKLATTAMLKYRISTLKTKLTDYYKTLGELKYSEMTGEDVSKGDFETIANEITVIKKKLTVLEKRVEDLDDFVNCPQCGYRVRRGLAVCPYCEYDFEADNAPIVNETPESKNKSATALPEITSGVEEGTKKDNL